MPLNQNLIPDRLNRSRMRFCRLIFLTVGLSGMLLSGCVVQRQPSAINLRGLAAPQAAALAWIIVGVTAAGLAIVTVLLLMARFRRQPGEWKPDQAPARDRRALAWVIIGGAGLPVIILLVILALSIPVGNAFAVNAGPAAGGPTIEVIGHQWWWEVSYPADGFETANEIHIPVGKPVTIRLTSADVIHNFWVPQLHPQVETIPGRTATLSLQADQPGTYPGTCAEYCGIQHAHMGFEVIAQSQADYDAWVARQKQSPAEPQPGSIEESGQQAFLGSSCVYCHTIRNTNATGKLGPDLTHQAGRATIGAGARANTPANLAGWVTNAQAIKPGNKMPPMNLDADQLPALLAYLESLK